MSGSERPPKDGSSEPVDTHMSSPWAEFLSASAASTGKPPKHSPDTSQPVPPRTSPTAPTSAYSAETPSNAITENDLYSDTMSCRDTFDRAVYCQSLGGQFMNVYRYGEFKDCGEIWSDFWFCTRIRSNADEVKRQKIRQRFMERDIQKYKKGRSSEDVWEARKVKLEKAFDLDPDNPMLK